MTKKEAIQSRLHIAEGFVRVLEHSKRARKCIVKSKNRAHAVKLLQEELGLTKVQAESSLELRMSQLSDASLSALKAETKNLKRELKHTEDDAT